MKLPGLLLRAALLLAPLCCEGFRPSGGSSGRFFAAGLNRKAPSHSPHHGASSLTPRMFSADFIATAGADLIAPIALVGSGNFLLNVDEDEPEPSLLMEALETKSGGEGTGEVDIYRDTALRYMGYANEVGEAFAPLVPGWCVPFSYFLAISYVLADTVDKGTKAYKGGKYGGENLNVCTAIETVDAGVWQLTASVALPGFSIHQVVAAVQAAENAFDIPPEGVAGVLPTAIGLITIPFIVKPLDELAEKLMDWTYRTVSKPYLQSCLVDP